MTATVHYDGTLTALSSIAHGGQRHGTITLLRRETLIGPDGQPVEIPLISGNSFRALLRHTAEGLLRSALDYEGEIPFAAAVMLLNGGRLTKAGASELSGRRLAQIRSLLPPLGIFGGNGAGATIAGCVQVGKVIPHLRETRHLTGGSVEDVEAVHATQQETYTRVDAATSRAIADTGECEDSGADQMLFRIETFPAGRTFGTWLRLERATDLEISFFGDVLAAFAAHGTLGGRTGIGHGRIRLELDESVIAGDIGEVDWRDHLRAHHDQVLDALGELA